MADTNEKSSAKSVMKPKTPAETETRSDETNSTTNASEIIWSASTRTKTLKTTRKITKKSFNCQDIDADKLVDAFGTYGRYQIFGYALCQLLNFFYSASIYVMTYIQMNPGLRCTYQNETLKVDESCWIENSTLDGQCGVVAGTVLEMNDTLPVQSTLKEFDLTCYHYIWKEAGLNIFTIGAMFTVPIFSALADRFGRRPVMLGSVTIAFVANVAATYAPNLWIFLILRFIVGSACDTYLSVASIMTCELISSKCRAWITLVYTISWSSGMFWVGILSLVVHDWRWMYFWHNVPAVTTILMFYVLPETPHWLIHHGNMSGVMEYVKTANKWNKTNVDIRDCIALVKKQKPKPQSLMNILRSRTMVKYMLIQGFITFTMSLYYFGISFLSVDLSEDHFSAFMLSAFVEIPGGLTVIPMMYFFGRRFIVSLSLLLQGLAMMVAPFATNPWWLKTALMLFGKYVNSLTYGVLPVYASEMVPTSVRSLSYSIVNVPQSLGIIASPYLKHVNMGPPWMTLLVLGASCVLSAFLVYFLPETKDQPMPPDIESLEKEGNASDDEDRDDSL